MGSRVMDAGELNGVRDYKRLGEMAKLATTYIVASDTELHAPPSKPTLKGSRKDFLF
jgi:hypothetical protein